MFIPCPGILTHVNVHARGALVTRRLTLPDALPDGDVTLALDNVTALAEPGSVRVTLPDGNARAVLAARCALVVPATGKLLNARVERVRDLAQRRQRLQAERDVLAELRGQLGNLTLAPGLRPRGPAGGPRDVVTRTADALATDAMLSTLLAELDARAIALDEALRDNGEALDAARLDDAQARTEERIGAGHPSQRVTVHLTGNGALPWVDVTYAVLAARWWPVYTLRIRDNARKATWIAEALVAQLTGEDWAGARLSLSTADLLFDARLPELPSLRAGRAQTPPRRAYRAAPQGLDRMFEGYDRAFVVRVSMAASAVATIITEGGRAKDDAAFDGAPRDEPAAQAVDLDMLREMPKGEAFDANVTRAGSAARLRAPALKPAAPAGPMPPPQPMPSAAFGVPTPRKSAGLFSALGGLADALSSGEQGGGGASEPGRPTEETAIEPADAWLDFDTLALRPADDRALRGRLQRETDGRTAAARAEARGKIDQVAAPQGARDPLSSRGMFDHRYDTEGVAEIPSDGQTHRVSLGSGETTPTLRWRTVPREGAEVYREAELRNPFDAPLLAGPVDVYLDGSLLAVASVDRIDRGGTMHVGMGLEQRLRVARNVRVKEETAGLLGGDTVVRHEVSIELSSARAEGSLVEVLDRLPVTEDKTVEIALERAAPEQERYSQADRGVPVRGGMAWRVIVPAAGRATVEYAYRITIPSKNEMVGGNRRD